MTDGSFNFDDSVSLNNSLEKGARKSLSPRNGAIGGGLAPGGTATTAGMLNTGAQQPLPPLAPGPAATIPATVAAPVRPPVAAPGQASGQAVSNPASAAQKLKDQ